MGAVKGFTITLTVRPQQRLYARSEPVVTGVCGGERHGERYVVSTAATLMGRLRRGHAVRLQGGGLVGPPWLPINEINAQSHLGWVGSPDFSRLSRHCVPPLRRPTALGFFPLTARKTVLYQIVQGTRDFVRPFVPPEVVADLRAGHSYRP